MTHTLTRTIVTALSAITLTAGLTACDADAWSTNPMSQASNNSTDAALQPVNYTNEPGVLDIPAPDEMAQDYFQVTGPASRDYDLTAIDVHPGQVTYCDTDDLDRARCAVGELTATSRDAAQQRGRQNIEIDPTGWGFNEETDIPAVSQVDGSTDYHGWLFNRSHLIADSLGGAPDTENAVTGTRTQNIGSTQVKGQYAGGMAHSELIARDYLDGATGADADACPLYYAATPNYAGDELVPRSVTVDMVSCDNAVDEHIIVYNTAESFDINYTDGSWVKN